MGSLSRFWQLTMLPRRYRRTVLLLIALAVILVTYNLHVKAVYKEREETIYDATEWLEHPTVGCQGHFTGYGHQLVALKRAKFLGNETFSIPCEGKVPSYYFLYDSLSPLGDWVKKIQAYTMVKNSVTEGPINLTPTFVYKRIEAHNLYHTLCEWFNVFMVSRLFDLDPHKVDILLLDDRPPSPLDETWDILFGRINNYKNLPPNAVFKNLILQVVGYNSPLNYHYLHYLPYAGEFHRFFLNSFGITQTHSLTCAQIQVTVIWRRDYMTHPERKNLTGGLVHRKFKNEDEILAEVTKVFPRDVIKTVVLEELTMSEQLRRIVTTDVLIGMHGAGMAHALFLPKHAVVLEFFPNYWGFLRHFKMFSKWRGVKYIGWQNQDSNNEFPDFNTRIPPEVVREHATKARQMIC